jgi:hypothetical protein
MIDGDAKTEPSYSCPSSIELRLHKHTHVQEISPLTIVKKQISDSLADSAERDGSYAKVGCDVVLGNPFDNIGSFLEQFLISLSRRVFEVGEEEL